jgi:hypothetical protein
MDESIEWIDDDQQQPRRQVFNGRGNGQQPSSVLGRLRELRSQMPCCQILSCLEVEIEVEDENKQKTKQKVVHTVDHALKDPNSAGRPRPHFCSSSFEFNAAGKVVRVHYCSGELPLDVPLPGLIGGGAS